MATFTARETTTRLWLIGRILSYASCSTFALALPASAQLFEVAHSSQEGVHAMASHAAHDPVHDRYFVVTGGPTVAGQYFDRSGRAVGEPILIDDHDALFIVRVVYSPDVSDGAGGRGGVVVIWSRTRSHIVFAQCVFPGQVVGGRQTIFAALDPSDRITNADIAYSPLDRVFVVALNYYRDHLTDHASEVVRLNLDAQPVGSVGLSFAPNTSCPNEQLPWACLIRVAWNPVSGEFAVVYRQTTSIAGPIEYMLARLRGDGSIVGRTAISGLGTHYGEFAANTTTGKYLLLAGSGVDISGVELSADGRIIARGFVTSALRTDQSYPEPLFLSYSPGSGTFLLAGRPVREFAPPTGLVLQLNQHGMPLLFAAHLFPSAWFGLAAHSTSSEWVVAETQGTSVMGTTAAFGGSNELLADCLTPDPFSSLGGGRCVNRGWLPLGHPLIPAGTPPPAPPPPAPTACTIPDPFTSLGGGVCINGGWVPRGHPLAGGGV